MLQQGFEVKDKVVTHTINGAHGDIEIMTKATEPRAIL